MITDQELAEIDRRVQAAGAANCWTGTAGAMAADCRRLVKEIRNEPANAPRRRGRLIGLAGPAGAGKDTAAAMIPGAVRRIAFADPLYRGLSAIFGVDESLLRDRRAKEFGWPELLGKSPRYLLQTLGTEWGRELVGRRVWLDLAVRSWWDVWQDDPEATIVVPDVRFENEASLIRQSGGEVWHIHRDVPGVAPHLSEAGIPLRLIDRLVANTGTVDELRERVAETFRAGA